MYFRLLSLSVKMNKGPISFCFVFALFLNSCSSDLDTALDCAGENRQELEKVLDHFKDNPNSLKYEAAVFLIKNMEHQYTFRGEGVDKLDELFVRTSEVALNKRSDYFNSNAASIMANEELSISPDMKTIKAKYLIKAINDACDMWLSTPWHEQFSKEIFFNFVLPYRLDHEPVSDWRKMINE